MDHAVVGFMPLDSDAIATTLELSSMQFGDAGRGPGTKGRELFALDTMAEFEARINRLAESINGTKSKRSMAISGTPMDDWLRQVALKAKRRWENRRTEKWCGHCGSPDAKSKCAGCGEEWYCGREHQKLGWAFHKGYCKTV
jgi:NADH pyrophosphatase NudC (nudix superfamily)